MGRARRAGCRRQHDIDLLNRLAAERRAAESARAVQSSLRFWIVRCGLAGPWSACGNGARAVHVLAVRPVATARRPRSIAPSEELLELDEGQRGHDRIVESVMGGTLRQVQITQHRGEAQIDVAIVLVRR